MAELRPLNFDFYGALSDMGKNLAGAVEKRGLKKDLSSLPTGPNGEIDYGKAFSILLGHGRPTEALAFARLGQSQFEHGANSDYRQQMLELRRQELGERPGRPVTELGRLSLDERAGHVSPEVADARRNMLTTRQPRQPNIVEQVRQKLAAGQPLAPGERRVYDDAMRADPLMRLLGQGFGGGAPQPGGSLPPVNDAGASPSAAPPRSTGPQPFESNAQLRQVGQVYSLPDGRQALWTQDAQGKVGWELLN